ncbi:MAG: hypothetical protein U0667_17215 [Chloroflexota bacterium]
MVSFGLLHRWRRGHWPRWHSYGYDFLTPLYACRDCHPELFTWLDVLPEPSR